MQETGTKKEKAFGEVHRWCFLLLSLVCVAGLANANTVWKPSDNGTYPPATGDWGVAANWTNGLPGFGINHNPDDGLEFDAKFSVTGEAECIVSDRRSVWHFSTSSSDAVIRIENGGALSTESGWDAVAYTNSATLIVESGGTMNFGGHAWIGFQPGATGTVNINGGTVNVTSQFGLGWNGGTGYVNVNSGLMNLSSWNTSQAITDGVLDIEQGTVVIDGDKVTSVKDYITAEKITAYGGTGTVLYDYDIRNAGQTTITATSAGSSPDWQVASTIYPTDDVIVIPYSAADFGIVADGTTDTTAAIQDALMMIGSMGGGTLFLPSGNYKVSGTLTVPGAVTLRGDWKKPVIGDPIAGTILQAYAGRGDENGTPFIELSDGSGVNGLSIWYPEQLPTDIQPYPPTVHGGSSTVENITFVNSYIGFSTFREGMTSRPFSRHVYGTPLKTGIEYDCLADIGRIETVHFSPDFWADSGLANAPTTGQHESWIYNNGTGVIVRRIDWSYSCYVTVEGYNIGFALRFSRYDGKPPNGQSYGFTLQNCKTGVYVEANSYAGYQFTRFNIQQAETGIYLGPAYDEATMFHTCTINSSGDALLSEGEARVLMMSCDIQQGAMKLNGGYLSVMNSDFGATAENHIELASGVKGASILGNTFTGGAQIVDNTDQPVNIDHTSLSADALPAYDYKKPETGFKAAKSDLFVVTESPYNAQADGVTDDTAAFQAALAAADVNGGGIVFVPAGSYRLDGTLTIPSGVELKGVFDIPHGTREKGSLLNVYAGRNDASGTPFIQIESDAGIRGLTFHYPAQIYDENDTTNYGMVPYPYLIRGLGSDIYVINSSATIPYQLLDLATNRCDRHYIDYILSTALKTGIHVGNGSVDGQIHNCQFNPSAYTHQGNYYDSIPVGTSDNIHKILWRDSTPYLFGHMSGEVLHENFVFGGAKGVHFVNEGGFGPSGYCLGMGVDQCTIALLVDDIGSGGLDMINSQIVTVNTTDGRYLETGVSFDDTFRMFSAAGWGGHEYSAVINGGDVKLQLFHLARDGETGVFQVLNDASLQSLGGNLTDYLALGRPFLTIDSTATAEFTGNIINTVTEQIPTTTSNVTSNGNLRTGIVSTNTDWTNGGANRLWYNAANWSNGAPTISGKASIKQGGDGPIIDSSTTAVANYVALSDGSSPGDTLDMDGGTLTTGSWFRIGVGASNDGTFDVSGGAATIGGDLAVGWAGVGQLNMTGGSIRVYGAFGIAQNGGSGHVLLNGATISCTSFSMLSGATMDIGAGSLIVSGNATSDINDYIGNGWLNPYYGGEQLIVDYGITNPSRTTVTAAPVGDNPVWVNFDYVGVEDGSQSKPYNRFEEGLAAVINGNGDTIKLAGNAADRISGWTGRITDPMRIELDPTGGPVRIGVLGAGSKSAASSINGSTSDDTADARSFAEMLADLLGRGRSTSNDTDDNSKLILDGVTYEPVLPFSQTEGGTQAANADSELAIRLRNISGIDLESISAPIPGYTEDEASAKWQPVKEGGLDDLWIVLRPQGTWYLDDVITIKVTAENLHGEAVEPGAYTFQVESETAQDARTDEPDTSLWQPEYGTDFDAEALDLDAESNDTVTVTVAGEETGTLPLEVGAGPAYVIAPEQAFEVPQRVWLPLSNGTDANTVQLYYHHANGDAPGWYPAGNVEGWLVPDSYLYLEINGTTYLGFLVRHAGIAQLGILQK